MFEYSSSPFASDAMSKASIPSSHLNNISLSNATPFAPTRPTYQSISEIHYPSHEPIRTDIFQDKSKTTSWWWILPVVMLGLLGYLWWKEDIDRFWVKYFYAKQST